VFIINNIYLLISDVYINALLLYGDRGLLTFPKPSQAGQTMLLSLKSLSSWCLQHSNGRGYIRFIPKHVGHWIIIFFPSLGGVAI